MNPCCEFLGNVELTSSELRTRSNDGLLSAGFEWFV